MNQQQLQTARAAHWHQNAQPLLTLDDSARWLTETGLCLFLPRHAQLPAPAPSFVEACMGEAAVTPPASAIARAMELAAPLVEEGRVIPLNLLGTFSEQPDFLISAEALRWAAAVRGDRNWKSAPAGRTAPIVLHAWEILDREGTSTAVEIREGLGREVTEAAVLRALIELWSNFRAMPIYVSGQPTRWSLLKVRHAGELSAAGNTAQTTALSVLVSQYLRSAVAATAEETEIFLSPLTARSRIREVIHGMMATRQLATTTLGSQTLVFVEGTLEELLPAPAPGAEAEGTEVGQMAAAASSGETLARPPAKVREDRTRERARRPEQQRAWQPGKTREGNRGRSGVRREEQRGKRPAATGPRKEFRGARQGSDEQEKRGAFRPGQPKPFERKREWQKGGDRPPRRFEPRKEDRGAAPPFSREAGEKRSGGRPAGASRGRPQAWQPRDRAKAPQRGEKREGGWKPFTRKPERQRPQREGGGPQAELPQRPGFYGGKERPRGKGSPPRGERPPRRDSPRREDRPGFQRQGFAGAGRERAGSQERPVSQRSSTQERTAGRGPERGGRKFDGKKFGGKPGFGGPGGTGPRRFSGPKGRFGSGKPSRQGRSGPPNRPERGNAQGKPFRKGRPPRNEQNPRKEENPQ